MASNLPNPGFASAGEDNIGNLLATAERECPARSEALPIITALSRKLGRKRRRAFPQSVPDEKRSFS